MKKSTKIAALLLSVLTLAPFAACGDEGGTGGTIGDDGEYRPGAEGKETKITFWGYGDENEITVFNNLVKEFNELYDGQIEVKYDVKDNSKYSETVRMALRQSKASVDVFYVGDADFKLWAENGYLEPLDSYLETSEEVVIDEMWATSVNRFKYDVDTTTQDGPNAHYWGIPKDIGPTVVFYNETYFNNAGVTVISVAAEDLEAFNGGAADSRGKTKADYGITSEVKEKGYFELDGKKWFNNQVPMSWEECVALSTLVQTSERNRQGKDNIYGYFTEWWFNYGWSVGGDCIEYVPSTDAAYNGGYWEFTLMDATPNYIVADDCTDGVTINGTKYNAGELIAWGDKLSDPAATADEREIANDVKQLAASGKLNELPSQRDAFVEFVRIGQKKDVLVEDFGDSDKSNDLYGYGICPNPTSIGGDAGKAAAFQSGLISMLVDGRWNVTNFRKQIDGVYNWDVAPLPQYKEYDAEGNVVKHGIEAGHSGSVALSVNAKSKKKAEAWLFCEFIGGRIGQSAQAESGFAIPSQKDLANSDVFLQPDKNPKNSIVFVRAAEYETPGDWWYLKDKKWIDDWAGVLNGEVRKGIKTLSQFETDPLYLKTWDLLKPYTAKK